MTFDVFLFCLLAASVLTGLVTQGIKILLEEWNVAYKANTLAGIVALVVGGGIGAIYMVAMEAAWNTKMAVCLIALVLLSWLCAMLGYDKVSQAIDQFRKEKDTPDNKNENTEGIPDGGTEDQQGHTTENPAGENDTEPSDETTEGNAEKPPEDTDKEAQQETQEDSTEKPLGEDSKPTENPPEGELTETSDPEADAGD